ncbi:MAG: GAF domain-containing sensor histidine kinase [Bdellovibrionota bacterium]
MNESFHLRGSNPRGTHGAPKMEDSPFTWQEHAYERLKVLYGVSKVLSSFDSVERMFPKILELCGSALPLATAVLIERRGPQTTMATWNSSGTSKDQLDIATLNASESFLYMTGSYSSASNSELKSQLSSEARDKIVAGVSEPQNYIVLPLVVDHLPAFGVIQLESSKQFLEVDLEFVEALADLIAMAVDRHHKSEAERKLKRVEAEKTTWLLSRSQAHVADLMAERELREKFVSLMSHDLRTPLAAIRISAQLAQRQAESPEKSRSLAGRIVSDVERIDQMISDLLDANRIRSGENIPLNPEPFDLSALLNATLEGLTRIHGDRFMFEGADKLEGYWDRRYLRRAVENLCNNAVKYGSAQTPIKLRLSQEDGKARIEVQNQGEPIPPEDQQSLFRQFRRSRKAQISLKKGWGIGLTLVRGVAEAHGGSVEVNSDAEAGTIFAISIPLDSRAYLKATSGQ